MRTSVDVLFCRSLCRKIDCDLENLEEHLKRFLLGGWVSAVLTCWQNSFKLLLLKRKIKKNQLHLLNRMDSLKMSTNNYSKQLNWKTIMLMAVIAVMIKMWRLYLKPDNPLIFLKYLYIFLIQSNHNRIIDTLKIEI